MFILKRSLVEQAFSLKFSILQRLKMCLSQLYLLDYVVLASACVYGLEICVCRHNQTWLHTRLKWLTFRLRFMRCVYQCGCLP